MPSSCSILDKASLEQCSLIDSTPTANKTRPAATERGMPLLQVRDLRTDLLRSASFSLSAGNASRSADPPAAAKPFCCGPSLDPSSDALWHRRTGQAAATTGGAVFYLTMMVPSMCGCTAQMYL